MAYSAGSDLSSRHLRHSGHSGHSGESKHPKLLWRILDYVKSEDPWTPSCELSYDVEKGKIGVMKSKKSKKSNVSQKDEDERDERDERDELDYALHFAQKIKKTFPVDQIVAQQLYDEYMDKLRKVNTAIMTKTMIGKTAGNLDGYYTMNQQYKRKAMITLSSDDTFDRFTEFFLSFGEEYYKSIVRAPTKEMPPRCWGAFELDSLATVSNHKGDELNDQVMIYKPKMSSWPFELILKVLSEAETDE